MVIMTGRVGRIAAVSLAAGFLVTGCLRPTVSAGAGYELPGVPIEFSASFTVNPDGGISVEGAVGLVTEAGIFSVHAGIETSAEPPSGQTVLIIRHWRGQELVDNVYHIGTDEEIIVTVNGRTVIGVSDHKVVINDSGGWLLHIRVRSAAAPAPPSRSLIYAQLRIGDCLRGSNMRLNKTGPWPHQVTGVACTAAHIAQVYYVGYWPRNLRFPGRKPLLNASNSTCDRAFRQYDGTKLANSRLGMTFIWPPRRPWTHGDRRLACIAYKPTAGQPGGATLYQSIKGTRW